MEPDDDRTQSHFSLTAGTAVSHYKIVSRIGSGGMGEVWLAEDTKLNRRVALKFMPAHAASDASLKARFTREAQAAAKLDHPNIVPVYEVGEFQGRPFFAMAHIEGQSLREVIKQGKLSVSEAIELTMQICEGLNEAHNEGVVHRDIKPGNIIIDTKGRARILDFGLATVAGDEKLTKTGSTLGTVGYMSPEQVEGKQVDHRTDLFSVGVILYEMLTGRRPFEGDNDAAVVKAITDSTPEPVARYKSGVTGELQQVIDKALTKDSSLRYQHADGMLADLKRLTAEPASVKRSNLRLWVAAAVVVCCVAGYFVVDRVITSSEETEGWTNSVAVLVFRDLSTAQDQDAFCEGMTEEIIGRLQSIRQLKVISTQSMLRFKGSDLDLKAIAKELAVDNILAGSVQKEADSIRVRAELISVEDDVSIWSDRYYREMSSVFAVQDDISRAIAEVLEMELTGDNATALVNRGTDDIEAYNAYLQGRYFWRKRAEIHLRRSIEFFERAIELDPDYALAYSGLADAWLMLIGYGISSPTEEREALSAATDAVEKALAINDRLAEVQASLGQLHGTKYGAFGGSLQDLEIAEEAYLRSIELNPGYVWSHQWYANLLRGVGRHEEWKRELMKAYELDPLSPVVLSNLAHYHDHFGERDRAEELHLRVMEIEPSFPASYENLARLYVRNREFDRALEMADEYSRRSPDLFYGSASLKAHIYRNASRYEEAVEQFERAIELAPERWDSYYNYANCLWDMHKWAEARKYFELALERNDNKPRLHRDYGRLLSFEFGHHSEGLKHLNRAVELNPLYLWAYSDLASVYDIVGNLDSALWAVGKAIELAPNDDDLVYFLRTEGTIYEQVGQFDNAVVSYRRALELKPDDYGCIVSLATIYTVKRDYQLADSTYEVLASHTDSLVRGQARSSQIGPLMHQGKFQQALDQLAEGISTDRRELGNSWPLLRKIYQRGRIYLDYLGRPDLAIEEFRAAEEVNQAFVASLFWTVAHTGLQAQAFAEMGQLDRAHILLENCLNSIDADDTSSLAAYHGMLASVLQIEGKYDSAIVLAKSEVARANQSNQFRVLKSLGTRYLAAEQAEKAAEVFEKALARYDQNRLLLPARSVITHYYLGQAYEAAGRTGEAIEQYETFLDIWKNADEGLESVEDAIARVARLKGGS